MDEYEAVKLTGEDRSTRKNNSPDDYDHQNLTWTGLELNPGLRTERKRRS
jgi:hypothetical protein